MLTEKKQKGILSFINVGIATGSLELEESDVGAIQQLLSDNGTRESEGMESHRPPRSYSYAETMKLLSISKTVLYKLIGDKKLNPVYLTPKTPRIKENEISVILNN